MEPREITYWAVALRIVCAVLAGGLIGLDRGLKNRPAGLRTYMLVCVGSCLVMVTNQYIFQVFRTGDPVRMGAQVVSGIGFLGAGTIVVTKRNQIRGLTTAAGLWASAGVGLALGIGFYEAALAGGFAIVAIMTLLQYMDNRVHRKTRTLDVYFELDSGLSLGQFLRELRDREIEIGDLHREQEPDEKEAARPYVATLRLKRRTSHTEILTLLREISGVSYAEEL